MPRTATKILRRKRYSQALLVIILGKGSDALIRRLNLLAQYLNITDRVIFTAFNTNPYSYICYASMLNTEL